MLLEVWRFMCYFIRPFKIFQHVIFPQKQTRNCVMYGMHSMPDHIV